MECERDEQWARLAAPLGVECVTGNSRGGWELKSHAMVNCLFDEVLLLDADNVPVVDPSFLFDSPGYRATGAVFWPDGHRTRPDSPCWEAFGVEYRDEPEQESGQILVDKSRCREALELCNWYNERSDYYYQFVYGDKDTFRLAWHKVGMPYSMPERGIEFIPYTLCQHDFQGRRIFQHRVHDKWSLLGNRRSAGFIHEDLCFQFLDELRELWQPIHGLTSHLSSEDRSRGGQLVGSRFELVQVGRNHWPVELAEHGRIATGYCKSAFFWWVEQDKLVLADANGKRQQELVLDKSGQWSSITPDTRRMTTKLVPL